MSLQGQIEEVGLGPIIQTLSLNRYRGTLRIETEAGSRFFFISEGEIVLVRQVKRDPVRLGDLLIRAGHLSEADLADALQEQKRLENTLRLGETLAKLELVTPAQIEEAVRSKFEDDFLDLFLLDTGRFEFIFGLTPEALFSPDERLERISLSTDGLMMEAMRRVDEWQEMIQSLGSFDTIYRNRTQSIGTPIENYDFEGISLPKQARIDLYELLDGSRSLREVIGAALRAGMATRLETFQYLHALEQNQLVKPMDFKTLLEDAKEALSSGDVQGAAKLIRAILTRKERLDLGLVKRYLGFLRKQQRPRLAFDEARRFAAQALADGDTDTAITLYEEAIELYRTPEVIDRLFYALLRANRRERAVEVGLELRDHLQSEFSLGLATRVAQNLRELDGQNPAVIELWGLIHMRSERNEEAVVELEKALALAGDRHPRRAAIVTALLELQPERGDLRDERELLELQEARSQLRREQRRRWISIAVTLVAVVLVWRGRAEMNSRSKVSEVLRILAEADELEGQTEDLERAQELTERYRQAGALLGGVDKLTTIAGRADELSAQISTRWAVVATENKDRIDELIARRAAEEKAAAERRARDESRQGLMSALTEYRGLVGQKDYAGASAKALAIKAAHPSAEDPSLQEQLKRLKVFALLSSTPPRAVVRVGGKLLGPTPQAIALGIGEAATARLHLPGHGRVEAKLKGDAFMKRKFVLKPGPSWTVELPTPPLTPSVGKSLVVIATPEGRVRCYGVVDGEPRWERDCPGKPPSLAGVALVGPVVVVTRGHHVWGLSSKTGQVEWEHDLGQADLMAPVMARVLNQEVALLAGGKQAFVLDAASGATLLGVSGLPAVVTHRPAGGKGWGFLPLADRCVGFSLASGGRKKAWTGLSDRWEQLKATASGPLLFASVAEAVIVPVAKNTELRLLSMRDGGVTPIAPSIGSVIGLASRAGTLFCLGAKGQLSSFRADGLEILAGKPVVQAASGGPALIDNDLIVVNDVGVLQSFSRSGRRRASPPVRLPGPLTQPLLSTGKSVLAVVGKVVLVVEPLREK
jgi:tetratricopeptide (TPR) repeat protein